MSQSGRLITRRDFIRGTACATLATATGVRIATADEETAPPERDVRVVLVRDPDAVDERGRINGRVVRKMLDNAVATLLDRRDQDPIESWKRLVKPTDVLGIKSNDWPSLPTPKEVEHAIWRRVRHAGLARERIGLSDRRVLRMKVFRKSTALINVRPMRTHHWAGVGGCIKNYVPFVRAPTAYHPDSCANLGAIWKLPIVRGKTRLNILVMLTPLFHGAGPHHFDRTYTWPYKGIIAGLDPVAVDTTGLRILQNKRRAYFGEDRPLTPPAKHIAVAEKKHRLGTGDRRRIGLVRLGWTEGILI